MTSVVYKERLDAMRDNIEEARKLQSDADVVPAKKGTVHLLILMIS